MPDAEHLYNSSEEGVAIIDNAAEITFYKANAVNLAYFIT